MNNWEKCLIGTVLSDPPSIHEVPDITPQDFESQQHQILWKHIILLAARDALTPRGLIESLRTSLTRSQAHRCHLARLRSQDGEDQERQDLPLFAPQHRCSARDHPLHGRCGLHVDRRKAGHGQVLTAAL